MAGAGETCRDQAAIAERAAGIPQGLLLAIGKRESGRFDAQTGGVLPWPWAVNREGEGRIFETREAAVAYVASAQREGSSSIDVGCFQINLKYHPTAFASLDQAFDPIVNAGYAARFLTELHDREGNWETAVADYHSATPLLGVPIERGGVPTWRGVPEVASQIRTALLGPVRVVMGIHIWTRSGFLWTSRRNSVRGAGGCLSGDGASGSGFAQGDNAFRGRDCPAPSWRVIRWFGRYFGCEGCGPVGSNNKSFQILDGMQAEFFTRRKTENARRGAERKDSFAGVAGSITARRYQIPKPI